MVRDDEEKMDKQGDCEKCVIGLPMVFFYAYSTHIACDCSVQPDCSAWCLLACFNLQSSTQKRSCYSHRSETGDRFLLQLFSHYLFHQVNENGSPLVDCGHTVHALNKLDASSDEQILLVSGVLVAVVAEVVLSGEGRGGSSRDCGFYRTRNTAAFSCSSKGGRFALKFHF